MTKSLTLERFISKYSKWISCLLYYGKVYFILVVLAFFSSHEKTCLTIYHTLPLTDISLFFLFLTLLQPKFSASQVSTVIDRVCVPCKSI
jgi:hypothetical protein